MKSQATPIPYPTTAEEAYKWSLAIHKPEGTPIAEGRYTLGYGQSRGEVCSDPGKCKLFEILPACFKRYIQSEGI